MKMQEIRALSTEELQAKLKEEKRNLQKLRFANAVSPIENPMRIRETKKLIARILTELRARELGIAPSKAE
ncbi:50S ribosomal protein L29 [Thermonema rossianum]|uniref:50S ribosomal protein L29 n=1 Tax=Thermonema rossianum TaxID=55505 RepID=UPI000571CB83|nr:50S ribosomal protein L29 [Thermonema rossianum]